MEKRENGKTCAALVFLDYFFSYCWRIVKDMFFEGELLSGFLKL